MLSFMPHTDSFPPLLGCRVVMQKVKDEVFGDLTPIQRTAFVLLGLFLFGGNIALFVINCKTMQLSQSHPTTQVSIRSLQRFPSFSVVLAPLHTTSNCTVPVI